MSKICSKMDTAPSIVLGSALATDIKLHFFGITIRQKLLHRANIAIPTWTQEILFDFVDRRGWHSRIINIFCWHFGIYYLLAVIFLKPIYRILNDDLLKMECHVLISHTHTRKHTLFYSKYVNRKYGKKTNSTKITIDFLIQITSTTKSTIRTKWNKITMHYRNYRGRKNITELNTQNRIGVRRLKPLKCAVSLVFIEMYFRMWAAFYIHASSFDSHLHVYICGTFLTRFSISHDPIGKQI